ncbi:hypothetical protein HMP0015_2257 [Acinetobacter haemolyticus ATCC 19194]|uniref:Uncharacterized protein n=1 Tax=Acinetobacter haemolyticus ATCC 19194 TaxID=707232 RepID=D4XRB5_ACIHA|nr:hypothetical protein HMP0015_2257 [Acinetobacter haemolyticus ATCC 19194]
MILHEDIFRSVVLKVIIFMCLIFSILLITITKLKVEQVDDAV